MKVVVIGTYPPRKCGIATFTQDLYRSLTAQQQQVDICAITDGTEAPFPSEVKYSIPRDSEDSYLQTANWINNNDYDCCIIQHEFGIFGNVSGDYILLLAERVNIPIITNLHTVLESPSPAEYQVLKQLATYSSMLTVMTNRAITMLKEVYDISPYKIRMIPHGIPDFSITSQQAKENLGLTNKIVMLSFGLLGPSKGYEVAIQAAAQVTHPDFVYIILGATHPNVLLNEGENYKDKLIALQKDLSLEERIVFVNQYASDELLQTYLKACDIYVTPYPNVNQMSSGTLTFALGAGAAVLSTPYWYAKDLLAGGRGSLFDFNDAEGLASQINELLSNQEKMQTYRSNALAFGKTMSWTNVARSVSALMKSLAIDRKARPNKLATKLLERKNISLENTVYFPSGSINKDRRSTI